MDTLDYVNYISSSLGAPAAEAQPLLETICSKPGNLDPWHWAPVWEGSCVPTVMSE